MISVIVVAYNAELSIARTLDSIINQTYKNFELIIINDGSIDKTWDVINDYAKKDNRIIKISRANLGVVQSRQEGLDLSKGEYSIFVDADDWLESDFLESLYSNAVTYGADMVICDMQVEYADKTEYLSQTPKELKSDVILGQMLKELHGSLCNKLISKSAYLRTGVRFLPDLNCCEDQYVIIALLSNNIKVSYCNKALYHYDKTINNDSITNKWLDFPVYKRVQFIKSIKQFIRTDFQKLCYNNYIGTVAYTATASSRMACPNYKELFREYQPQIMSANIPIYKKIICLLRLKGINIPVRLVKLLRLHIRNINNKNRNKNKNE